MEIEPIGVYMNGIMMHSILYIAEHYNRNWIGIIHEDVTVNSSKQRKVLYINK